MCVPVSVCPPPRLVITSGVITVMWYDIDPYDWLNKFYSFYMAAIVSIISRHGLTTKVHCRNQPNKSKLALLHFNNHLKQLLISDKMEHFSYKGGCGIRGHTRITMFKRRAGLGYK